MWLHILFNITFIIVIIQHLICDAFLCGVGKQKWNVPKTKFNLHHSPICMSIMFQDHKCLQWESCQGGLRPEMQMANVQVTNKEWCEPPYSSPPHA